MILGEFLKAQSRIEDQGRQTTAYELPASGHVLKQSTFPALKQLAIADEKSQKRARLHSKQARGKLANIVPPPDHFLFGALRLARYDAGDSAICIPLLVSAGSKTMRTRACKTRATRRSMLREWPS